MTEQKAQPTLPLWAKAVIAAFLLLCVLAIGSLLVGASFMADFIRNARNPSRMAAVAQHIVRIDNPLPAGFSYEVAIPPVPLVGWVSVVLSHAADHTVFYLVKMPNPNRVSAKKLVDQAAKQGPGNMQPLTVASQGQQVVAGEEMQYVMGATTSPTGTAEQEMIGVIVPKGKTNSVLVVGLTPGEKYNMEATDQLLAAIKGF